MRPRAESWPRAPVWVADLLLALFVTFMQVQGTVARQAADPASVERPLEDLGNLGYVLLIAGGLVIAFRRRWPTGVFVFTGLISLVYYGLELPDGPGWLSLFVAAYTVTAHGDGRRSLVVAALGTGILSAGWLLAATDIEPRAAIGWVFFRIVASVMSAAFGESVRSRQVIAAEALDRAVRAERTRDEEARARVDQERLRIAREVHDTVAHAIAVINVQAGVTAHVLDKRPERARETLESIEQSSSQALREMRAILGVLRDGDDRAPMPGLAQLDELAGSARDAGLDVKLEANAPPAPVPSAVGTAVYRIVQEAITNVIRHVGPTRVTVTVVCGLAAVEVRVVDQGRTSAAPAPATAPDSSGRGIRGMRERCRLLGGELDAGPVPGGGFQVAARLPLAPAGVVPA
jgi:signal transduction histidine kinase